MFISLLVIFATSFVVALSGALMPGPLLTITVSESARRGWIAGPLIILGHGILELLLVVAISFGFGEALTRVYVLGTISVIGGIVLFWMGWSMLRGIKKKVLFLSLNSNCDRVQLNPILAGVLGSLANPYWTIWWATIGLGYIAASIKHSAIGLALFYIGHILADLAWYTSVSLAIGLGQRIISDKMLRNLITCCGILLMGFSIYFGYSGIKSFVLFLDRFPNSV